MLRKPELLWMSGTHSRSDPFTMPDLEPQGERKRKRPRQFMMEQRSVSATTADPVAGKQVNVGKQETGTSA